MKAAVAVGATRREEGVKAATRGRATEEERAAERSSDEDARRMVEETMVRTMVCRKVGEVVVSRRTWLVCEEVGGGAGER